MQQPEINRSVISAEFPYRKKYVEVNGQNMAYVDVGSGPIVLFLQGNPTSSYLWRNIIPYVFGNHQAIAIDLIGMGDSATPEIDYTFVDHAALVDGFIETLGLENITLVVHNWGSALGSMRYTRLNEGNVRAVAFMETHILPGVPVPNYETIGPIADVSRNIRTKGVGEKMIHEENFFVEEVLPKMVSES